MRYLFLIIGLFLIISGGTVAFVRPGVPTTTDLLAYQFILGGFILLGISQVLKLLQARTGV
jgi:pantothenate kinase type III